MTLEYNITKQWDSVPVSHNPVNIIIKNNTDNASHIVFEIRAPFFNDPPNPGGVAGKPFQQLWDYEVVEAFFLNDNDQYLEVEFCPHGQHLVLLLKGRRQAFKDLLPMQFTSSVEGQSWHGTAHIPTEYFPPKVSKFNAYAIHGSGDHRTYEALYPSRGGAHDQPDFHRLEYFQPINFKSLLPGNWTDPPSSYWE